MTNYLLKYYFEFKVIQGFQKRLPTALRVFWGQHSRRCLEKGCKQEPLAIDSTQEAGKIIRLFQIVVDNCEEHWLDFSFSNL